MIVDAHAHIFPRVQGRVAAGPTRGIGYGRIALGSRHKQLIPPLCETTLHTPEMLIAHMDWVGVDKAVLLQGAYYGECNDYVLDAVGRYPDRLLAAAYLDPWEPDCKTAWARGHADRAGSSGPPRESPPGPQFAGVKLEMSEPTGFCGIHPGAALDAAEIAWLWRELEQRDLVLTLDLGAVGSASYQTAAVREIAQRHPRLRIVIAHLGQPTPAVAADTGLRQQWEAQIDLAKLPNVWFDTASLPAYWADEGCPFPSVTGWLQAAIDRIGAAKLLWGTDIPGSLCTATYPQYRQLAELHLDFLSPADRALILGENAVAVYG